MTATPTDLLVRDALKDEIAKAKAKHDRMPVHWEARRHTQMVEVFRLIDHLNELNHGRPATPHP